MQVEKEKAAKIQELLKKLAKSDAFESAAITKQIKLIATEDEQHRIASNQPVTIDTVNQ